MFNLNALLLVRHLSLHRCLQMPHCPPDTKLLEEAEEVFRCFLTWPEPFSSLFRNLLSTLQLEQKAPGKSVCGLLLALDRPLVANWKHADKRQPGCESSHAADQGKKESFRILKPLICPLS